jgi:exodeoxyribonuclease-3
MTATIASWNINSVRLRLDQVLRFLSENRPDALCLQEIKCMEAHFPSRAFAEAGYSHIAIAGQKGYHGVATLSRHPFKVTGSGDFCRNGHARHIEICFEEEAGVLAGIRLHNFYVPAGGDEPDPARNDKFAHKLDFLESMRTWSAGLRKAGEKNVILTGDLNIAPLETDVWSHKQLLRVVSHTPVETEGLGEVLRAGGWVDAVREIIPAEEKLYSWWSYRAADWAASDRGRRLDHIWTSPDLRGRIADASVLREVRGWERPSDHAPVLLQLKQAGS